MTVPFVTEIYECKTLDELKELWGKINPHLKKLDTGRLSTIVKAKEVKKVDLLMSDSGISDEGFRDRVIGMSLDHPERVGGWDELLASGKTDSDVDSCSEALFLFAARKLQDLPMNDACDLWDAFCVFWRRRLPQDAYHALMRIHRDRLRTVNLSVFEEFKREKGS